MVIKNKPISLDLALLCILLLAAQQRVLNHAVEHLFHTPDQSCQIFIQAEQLSNGLIFTEIRQTLQIKIVYFVQETLLFGFPHFK
jgi:hypothetical protein